MKEAVFPKAVFLHTGAENGIQVNLTAISSVLGLLENLTGLEVTSQISGPWWAVQKLLFPMCLLM